MNMEARSKQLANPECKTCDGTGVVYKAGPVKGIVSDVESCQCTIRTFPDWKGNPVTKKPSDPWYEHDYNQRPG